MGIAYRMLRWLARLVIICQMRFQVAGLEHVPRDGSVLLVSNHLGIIDPAVICVRFPREVRFSGKAELFGWPVIGWVARVVKAVPIHRGESDRAALRRLGNLLTAKECVLVFPEGTYADPPDPAAMIPLKTGAAFLAMRTGAAVLPVGITGTERVWLLGRGWRPWRRPRVHVRYGAAYRPAPPPGLSAKATYQYVTDEMARRIAELLPEAYRGQYLGALDAPHGVATVP